MYGRIFNATSCFEALAGTALHEKAFRWLLANEERVVAERRRLKCLPKWQAHADKALVNAALRNRYLVGPLLRCGADPSYNQSESLSVTARMSTLDDAEALLARGARAEDNDSLSLSKGMLMGVRPMVQLLLEAGADPRARQSEALHEAGKLNYHDIFVLLLDAGADPRARGVATLIVSSARASVECVQTLLSRAEYSRKELLEAAERAAPSTRALILERLRAVDLQTTGSR